MADYDLEALSLSELKKMPAPREPSAHLVGRGRKPQWFVEAPYWEVGRRVGGRLSERCDVQGAERLVVAG